MPSATRVAKNESLFREVNERISSVAEGFASGGEQTQQFVCECSRLGCIEPIELTLEEYAAVRATDVRFAVAQGHFDPAHEEVVLRKERYWVVEKDGVAGEVAAEERGP
jgi:hypothetical protein